ncbi:uncharacterized protein FPOAC1_013398 [Fusarium poae]|uniref:uncharacterized protein n=1 Tax=Fusarium poae TaxID=36050 RepID=UPI001D0465D6|nr:uncharacterized protein FPOAC1_013398 [Fusarium poae]KAG8664618.1 hypothetical protein FPOAC1_013398 [Fusarium poae]
MVRSLCFQWFPFPGLCCISRLWQRAECTNWILQESQDIIRYWIRILTGNTGAECSSSFFPNIFAQN